MPCKGPGRPSVRCPACKEAPLSWLGSGEAGFLCGVCGTSYPLADGVIDLLPADTGTRTLSQSLMEWPPVIRIYESRWWRKSPVFARYTGIPFEREYRLVASAVDLPQDAALLDLACGPGIYSRPLARERSRGWVVGLDISAPMLGHLGRTAAKEGLSNLIPVRGSALDLPFEPATFHAVNCCGALHLFSDAARALEEVHRVLRPGGTFTAAVLGRPSGAEVPRLAGCLLDGLGLRAFSPGQLESFLHNAGFREVIFLHRKEGWGWLVVAALR